MKKTNRREFTGHLVAGAAIAGMGPFLAGCPAPTVQSVLDELNTWVPVAIATFDGVVAFVDSALTAASVAVHAAWSALQAILSAYLHTTDPTTTAFDKVIAALDAVAAAMTQITSQLPAGIPANILEAAEAAFALIIATLKDIRSRLQPTTAPTAVASIQTATHTRVLPPPAKSTKDFVNQINAIMKADGQTFRVK